MHVAHPDRSARVAQREPRPRAPRGRHRWGFAWWLLPGVLALVYEPGVWLARTWTEPAHDSFGGWVALGCLGLVARSVLSGPAPRDPRATAMALRLLLATAAARLAGRLLAVNILGALALVFDVAAVALALRTHRRPWAVPPAALAALFVFALPLEQILQRTLGFPLRWTSAVLAGGLLKHFDGALERAGTLLVHPEVTLSIDLPCSGAEGLTLLGVLATLVACRRRVGRWMVVLALAVVVGTLLANTTRIVLLFAGARRSWPVFVEPGHSLVGLLALLVGASPLLLIARRLRPIGRAPAAEPGGDPLALDRAVAGDAPGRSRPGFALAFTAAAFGVAVAPARPLDVSASAATSPLPAHLGDWLGQRIEPTDLERAYFTRFGGTLEKRVYGDEFAVMRVRTTAPLRHLHGPERCLVGAGHQVERLGVVAGGLPVVRWRSVDPEGRAWRIDTLFLSDAGETAATVSEVVWRWVSAPGIAWSLLERIAPETTCRTDPHRCAAFDRALYNALDLEFDR